MEKNKGNKVIPIFRKGNEQYFVDSSLLPPHTVIVDINEHCNSNLPPEVGIGLQVPTSALAINKCFSLLAISQCDEMLEAGLQDTTDDIDTSCVLTSIYIQLIGKVNNKEIIEVFKINVENIPTAAFIYATVGDYRTLNLQFTTSDIIFDKNTKTISGADSELLTVIGDYSEIHLYVCMAGYIKLEIGDAEVCANPVNITRATDKDDNLLAIDAEFLNSFSVIGYDLSTTRVNYTRHRL